MVVFTCNNCGESLQKPKVAKHYQFQCRRGENLTCVDCHKDFYGQEYVAHTKCITESERYGGQNYTARPGQNKGEKKQEAWINVIRNVLDTAANLSRDERNLLNILANNENIPRKKAKFLNFIRSAMGHRVNMTVVDSVWVRMETAFKQSTEKTQTQSQTNGEKNSSSEVKVLSPSKHPETSIAENQNNENISRENGNVSANGTDLIENGSGKKSKTKKRELIGSTTELEEQPPMKKNKKKSEESIADNSSTTIDDESGKNEKFDWKAAIVEIIGDKEEMAVKKLRKRVVNRYVEHCNNTVTLEKATSRFDKKLRKLAGIIVNDDKVKLA